MKFHGIVLPGLALGAAALLIAPAEEAVGFSKIGGDLSTGQRDFRVFNNFADAGSNNNTTIHPNWPGWDGAELAIWKGSAEWGSVAHGDGSGDTAQPNIGDGNANFDAFFSGTPLGIGNTDHNIVSTISSCGGGTLAFTETPISNGWRIRFCDNWTWHDGPGNVTQWDIQGVQCHEYGHALGLGHSGTGSATMAPSVGQGQEGPRSINFDDIAGLQCIYGVKSGTKPRIFVTDPNPGAGTITIIGENFTPTDNSVWFTSAVATANNQDPRVRVIGVPSTAGGTSITVSIPVDAGQGDVLVKNNTSGFASLSNAFPTDLQNLIGDPPGNPLSIESISPSTVDALIPGTGETVTASGFLLDDVTSISLGATPIPGSRWTIVDENTITIDMPQAPSLGVNTLTFNTIDDSEVANITVEAPAEPKFELGTGDPFNVVSPATGIDVIVSSDPGDVVTIYYSPLNIPSNSPILCFDIGSGFSSLFRAKAYTIPAAGWIGENIPLGPQGGPSTFYSQGTIFFSSGPGGKWEVSNVQSIGILP